MKKSLRDYPALAMYGEQGRCSCGVKRSTPDAKSAREAALAMRDWTDPNHGAKMREIVGAPDWIVTNPPYAHAAACVRAALAQTPRVAMLLRLSWLEACADRTELLSSVGAVLVVGRPSWRGPGGALHKSVDSVASAWFVWGWRPATLGAVVLWGSR